MPGPLTNGLMTKPDRIAIMRDIVSSSLSTNHERPAAYVYGIGGIGYVKIGIASRPQQRLGELQTGNHLPLAILFTIPSKDRKTALSIEQMMHRYFSRQWIRGEWFALNDEQIRQIKHREGIFPCNRENLFTRLTIEEENAFIEKTARQFGVWRTE